MGGAGWFSIFSVEGRKALPSLPASPWGLSLRPLENEVPPKETPSRQRPRLLSRAQGKEGRVTCFSPVFAPKAPRLQHCALTPALAREPSTQP